MYIQLASLNPASRSEIDFVQKRKPYNDTQSNIDFITTSTLFNVEPSKHRRILTSTLHIVGRELRRLSVKLLHVQVSGDEARGRLT